VAVEPRELARGLEGDGALGVVREVGERLGAAPRAVVVEVVVERDEVDGALEVRLG
jgi:hypothetical protein